MKLKKVLACTLLGITMITSANVATTYAAVADGDGDTPLRDLGRHYGVSVKWNDNSNEIIIADLYHYSTKKICDRVVNGTCMKLKDSFHNLLHDKDIDHKNCDYEK
ncbi:hypothetical protein U732_3779 [Clostridium argentinense CDC 2741]|uniref:Copper amine oxidase-like N-terminal domain-containing protein n=2 Tax=Clostridium argentinense TaxID=29341 RepID=A0A0C1ULB2_9CLOT|nr:hypothetical protein [Clostridium argentinense]KIE48045.1 hypothetical protein U732_3779 [Clostridium argentinense CDC 2741]ARC85213.1 hypothetical protein RSJ17_12240 [Clostridium argentinense]NFP50969.1 hypothetical protein [Clostridium argentinense]NFP73637.1 hypothetical protein [Clostridium argentinense]NFP78114.1 hypothetical protein [Clostridium argentinense]